jgi:hypothetical protein
MVSKSAQPIGSANLEWCDLIEIYNPGINVAGAVTLDGPFLPKTLDAVQQTGVLNRPGGYLRVVVWKDLKSNKITFVPAMNDAKAAAANTEIVKWYATEHKLSEEAALRVLNEQTTLDWELSQQEAA